MNLLLEAKCKQPGNCETLKASTDTLTASPFTSSNTMLHMNYKKKNCFSTVALISLKWVENERKHYGA